MGGICGVTVKEQNAQMITYYAMYSLQHRGEYGCGIASDHNGYIDYEKGHGLVTNVLDEHVLRLLRGKTAIGHVSNSQTEIPTIELDPKVLGYKEGAMALVFDGYLLNYDELKEKVDSAGVDFENVSHTEIVGNLIALNYKGDLIEALRTTLEMVKGAYALLLMTDDVLIGVRDRYGIKPLVFGSIENGYMFASETCSFDAVSGEFIREIEPGEMVIVEDYKPKSVQLFEICNRKSCIFEGIYYARPDSIVNGVTVYRMRNNSGKLLALANGVDAEVVIAAPDSGTAAAIGFAEESKIPFGIGIIKNRYIGRTFIERGSEKRIDKVRIKLNVLKEIIVGKDVLVVDDSIVRGTTMKRTVKMLRDAGAKSVHVRIASPMVYYTCKIGVNQSVTGNMIAADHNQEEIREIIDADSLKYISIDDLLEAFGDKNKYCTGCINDIYPFELEE